MSDQRPTTGSGSPDRPERPDESGDQPFWLSDPLAENLAEPEARSGGSAASEVSAEATTAVTQEVPEQATPVLQPVPPPSAYGPATPPVTGGPAAPAQPSPSPRPATKRGPNPGAILLGLACLTLAVLVIGREVAQLTVNWAVFGPGAVIVAGLVLLLLGVVGLMRRAHD